MLWLKTPLSSLKTNQQKYRQVSFYARVTDQKSHANQTQNSHLKQCISWVLGDCEPHPIQSMTIILVNNRPVEYYILLYNIQYIYLFLKQQICKRLPSIVASHKSNPSFVPQGVVDSYSTLPWVTWEAVTGVEGIPCWELIQQMLANRALVYPSQGGRYHAEGCMSLG